MKATCILSQHQRGDKAFVAFAWFVGWSCFSLGFHVCLSKPNLEIHLPFGFIKIGWDPCYGPISWKPRVLRMRDRSKAIGWNVE